MNHYTYKFRISPTKQQQFKLNKHFGCHRFIYNCFLNKRIQRYKNNEGSTYNKDSAELTIIKKEYEWLHEPNAQSLQRTLRNLDTAFNRFFTKKSKFPKFKKKNRKQSFIIPQYIKIKNDRLCFPKFSDGIKIKQYRELNGKIVNATISNIPCGHYYVSILVEKEIQKLPKIQKEIGIDLGIKDLAICSDGKKYKNINPYRNLEKKLVKLSRRYSKKKKGSNNREKARIKLAKLHNKISNIRNDYLHKVSRQIVNKNQVICLEDLNVGGMLKNHKLAKSIADVSLSELVRQITYKSEWYGRIVIFIDKWYPSSKACNNCGYINENLTLKDRDWTCYHCNINHDRDVNAAKNILAEGKRILKEKTVGITELACGEESSGLQSVSETVFCEAGISV